MNKLTGLCCLIAALFFSCNTNDDTSNNGNTDAPPESRVAAISYTIKTTVPHDTSYFTEGLEFYNGMLLESTGNYGKSKLVETDLATGKAKRAVSLDSQYFGEGLTVLRDTIYQLTYREHKVLAYSLKDFKKIAEYTINTEGWGLTNNGKQIIATDGSSSLYYYEPGTFKLLSIQEVREGGSPAVNLNELEYVDGYLYANQWQYPYILKIDPKSGEVIAKMDFTTEVNKMHSTSPAAEVLNGLAYNPATKKFYVTGKNWPQMFEIDFAR